MADREILAVDDDVVFLKLVEDGLTKSGYSVTLANNGQNAVEIAKRLHPDLILLDINMPGMDGFAVLTEIKGSEDTASIPVIMLTERADQMAKLSASILKCDQYIAKPFDLKGLLEQVRKYVK